MQKDLEQFFNKDENIKYSNQFYKIMVEYLGEEIFVTDGEGKCIFCNPASVKAIGLPVDEIVGKTVYELRDAGYFSVSCTEKVLKSKKVENVIQILKDGRPVLATGVPIFDKNNEEIIMVIVTSKDVDEVNKLLSTVASQEKEILIKDAEIEKLRNDVFVKEGFIAEDTIMRDIKEAVIRIAPLKVTVLIEGETGSGKEVVARTLHRFSDRKDKSFVKINCGIIPENLIESELFGYEKGAFTGAEKEGKLGQVELADGGTLFLDEIGEMPLSTQVKLLDFLQDGTFTRVGGTEKIQVDARIIAATNRDLKAMSEDGTFRQDLYFRLSVIPLRVPSLRERIKDIDVLVKYFISKFNKQYNTHKMVDSDAITLLKSYYWPGNVRELEHVIERAFVMTDSTVIQKDMFLDMGKESHENSSSLRIICSEMIPLKEAKNEVEKQLVTKAYEIYGSTYKVAEILGVNQSTIVKIMKKYRDD